VGTKDIDPHEVTKAESIRPGKMRAGLPIGGYSLLEVLGEGGMGVVWSAHDPNLDRMLAIKVLKRQDAAPALRKRLLREARAMARLKHPNVLTVYEVGTEGDRDFIAMELVDGGSLDEWLDRDPPRDDVITAVLAAGRGLAAAHAAGLVHRDFKPHNVLRSRDGRVLVTDFGLARGLGEESASISGSGTSGQAETAHDITMLPSSPSGRTTDSLLDSPLTQTGAMIGTPAYMAPEQFLGAAPDPRTDQFAFCVTAWQALTGMRPYTGATIDELRKAASAGVAPSVKVDLPPVVRAALVRGLDPDPAKRWPTLDELLDALEHAVRPRRPRWVIPVAALAVIAVVAIAVAIARRGGAGGPVIAAGCGPGEDAFAEAWSPKIRADIERSLHARGIELPEGVYARIADPMDAYRERWTQAFATACKAREKVGARQRACLLGERDQTASLALVLRDGSAPMYAKLDLHGLLPELAGCAGDSPNAPPLYPEDPQARARVIALMAKALALTGSPTFEREYPALEAEAAASGWAPLLPILQLGIGNELLRRGDPAHAREEMARVLRAPAEARDPKTVAQARFGMLDASLVELAEPQSTAKPGELHHELAALLVHARSEVKAAGNDPMLAGALAGFEARAEEGLAQGGWFAKAYDDALAHARLSVAQYQAAADPRRAARMSAVVAQLLVARDGSSALDDAMFTARTAAEALTAAKLDPEPALDRVRAALELQRGEYTLAQGLYARAAGPPSSPPAKPLQTGKIIGATGKPIRNARIVAWHGELAGDPTNVVTDLGALGGERVESDADGSFSIHADLGDALIAEFADVRSAPVLVTAAPALLKLEPTTMLNGTIDRPNLIGVFAAARYTAGGNVWELRVPVTRDKAFHMTGLPRGTPVIAVIGDATSGRRRVVAGVGATKLAWPIGEAIEVIARGAVDDDATVWVFRGKQAPAKRIDAEVLAGRVSEVAWAGLGPIGADNTDAGRAFYEAGDHHAVISGNLDGDVSVCLARNAASASAVICKVITIKQTRITDPDDGPGPVAVTPVLFAQNPP
jgi:predicted Ser/Thr protein kinase